MKAAQSSEDNAKITESENSRKAKRWFFSTLVLLTVLLIGTAAMVIFVDPYFHYHKPLSFLSYRIYEERYVNDGISRHFTYDAVITGTSMAQNFKTSELDELFGTHSVKEPFSGADFRELSENLNRTLQYGQEVKMVVMPLDYNALLQAADWQKYEEYPTYLYDNNIFNDARYVWNKAIFYHGVVADLLRTVSGEPSTTMDEYSSWVHETGLEHIMASYTRADQHPVEDPSFNEEDRRMVEENITKNIVDLVNLVLNFLVHIFLILDQLVLKDLGALDKLRSHGYKFRPACDIIRRLCQLLHSLPQINDGALKFFSLKFSEQFLQFLLRIVLRLIKPKTPHLQPVLGIQKCISHLPDLCNVRTKPNLHTVGICSISGCIIGVSHHDLLSRITACRGIGQVMCRCIQGLLCRMQPRHAGIKTRK